MMFELRPYQSEAIAACHDYWDAGNKNALLVLPTGAGKSLVIADLIKGIMTEFPNARLGMITHVKELIEQNCEELVKLWPQAPVGIYSAGIGRRDARAKILFMGIQSVHKRAKEIGGFDLLLIDEAHLIPRSAETMYGRFLADCREIFPDMALCGLTATPYRLDSGRLDRGQDRIFDKIVYDANVADLIEQGYLSNLVTKATHARINTQNIGIRAGEFKSDELSAAAHNVIDAAVKEVAELGQDRQGWLAFCVDVGHAKDTRDAFRAAGVSCEMITGKTPKGEREQIIKAYKNRQIRCLTSVGVLTTGFNAPHVDLIAMLRPTLSTGLYIQMIGRGLRLAEDKENCLVLDFAGNTVRHGPVDDPTPSSEANLRGSKEDDGQVERDETRGKECPDCMTIVSARAWRCWSCGFEFEQPHQAKADETSAILSRDIKPTQPKEKWLNVTDVRMLPHKKMGSPDSLRIDYDCGLQKQSEWLCFEHGGYAASKAAQTWLAMGGMAPAPETVREALARKGELRTITGIQVKPQSPGSKFFKITKRLFEAEEAELAS